MLKLNNMRAGLLFVFSFFLQCCSISSHWCDTTKEKEKALVADSSNGPPITLYKTKKDYSNNVPVTLSKDKTVIVSYPHPSDVFYNGELAYPQKLRKNYLLDNMGINIDVAYLSITLEEYSKLKEVPSLTEMNKLLIDKDPLTALYFCGNRYLLKDEIAEINKLIKKGFLKECNCLVKE